MKRTAGAQVVVDLRTRLHLTQEELAARSGLGLGMIRKIEQGDTKRPRRRNLEILDQALCADGQVVAAFEPEPDPPPSINPQMAGELQKQVLVLSQQVRSLAVTVRAQGAEMERLKEQLRRRGM